ncbi:hypothetical protein PV-S19_0134 [Pacmanvirus S19]|nr:hypothetical protein PV-S19_0134 [Pacmanvirus S19]
MGYSTGVAVGIATGTMLNGQIIGRGGGSPRDPDDDSSKYFMKHLSNSLFVGFISSGVFGIGLGAITLLTKQSVGKKRIITTLPRQVKSITTHSKFREDITEFLSDATLFSFGISGFLGASSLFCWTCYKVDKFLSEKPKAKNNKNDKY